VAVSVIDVNSILSRLDAKVRILDLSRQLGDFLQRIGKWRPVV
jgi:hypothetical protein